ncbi:MAG: hypothetical protein ACI9Y1_003276 [Lentisphaeria bacterium]|jgi:uncharacterized protein (TIGR00266 family)
MNVDLLHRPGNTAAKVTLQPGETCTAESGAMIAMSGHMSITTTTHKKNSGGFLKAAKRMIAGESFFLNHFDVGSKEGELWLGTTLAGDMKTLDLENESIIVQSGSFLACEDSIDIDMSWQGFKSLLSGENVIWLKLTGSGTIVLSSFGAIYPVEVDGEYIVNSGHIVAFNESLDFSITKAGKSWWHSYLGGEGLVCKFHGRGTLWCQSHNPRSFGLSLTPNLRARKA